MKINGLANEILKEAFHQYNQTHSRIIESEPIYSKFEHLNKELINDAFRSLESDNLIKNYWGSGEVYDFELQLDTIRDKQEYSRLKTVYSVLKEIRDWILGY